MNSHLPQSRCTAWFHLLILLLALLIALPVNAQQPSTAQSPVKTREEVEADKLNGQAIELFNLARYEEALLLVKQSIKLREKVLGKEHVQIEVSLTNLGALQSKLGKNGDAASTYRRLLKLQEKLYGETNLRLCKTLSAMGWALIYSGSSERVEGNFKRALQINETAHGTDSKELLPQLNDLASIYQRTKRLEQSIAVFKRMIVIQEKHLGTNHPAVAELLVKCAIVLRQHNEEAEADQYEARARNIYAADSQTAPKKIQVSEGVLSAAAILKVQPSYPAAAKESRSQGAVRILIEIDESGIVESANAIEGPEDLRKAAVDAARQWRFKPTMLQGKTIKVQGVLTFHFKLEFR